MAKYLESSDMLYLMSKIKSMYAPIDHGHTGYMPSTGGTLNGNLSVTGTLSVGESSVWHAGNLTPGNYLPRSGGTMTGTITNNIAAGNEGNILYGTIADNDFFRLRAGGSSNAGWIELATADDGTEPIYIRQYTGVYASCVGWACIDANHNFVSSHEFYTHSGGARCWDTYDFYIA